MLMFLRKSAVHGESDSSLPAPRLWHAAGSPPRCRFGPSVLTGRC